MSKNRQVKISGKKNFEYEILCKSLIGKNIKIVDSKNLTQIGLSGILVYESANIFYLNVDGNLKKILKNSVIIELELENKKFQVNGCALLGNIVSRIKKIK